MKEIIYEDKNICAKCGGFCCKKCGCDYFVSDFDNLKIEVIENALNTGRVSIVSALDFKRLPNGKLTINPILYLRARNINRGEIDLLSFKTTCASLEENGCHYNLDERPSGGVALIPKENMECYSEIDRIKELEKWLPYQNILKRVVKRHTGMSVYEKLKKDVVILFVDLFTNNLDYVNELEIKEVKEMIPLLKEIYPEEIIKAGIVAKIISDKNSKSLNRNKK